VPIEPAPSQWEFPPVGVAGGSDVVAGGADLAPGTVLAAYRRGLFPMPDHRSSLLWWSPVDRGVIEVAGHQPSRSMRRARAKFEIRVDTAFDRVIRACADPRRPGSWIDRDIIASYTELHRLGWVHSVEAWDGDELAGGLYGVAIGGLFAGESMFHRVTDASKVALVGLVELLTDEHAGRRLLDVQWRTPHLASLGVVELPRAYYARLLKDALEVPLPAGWR